jgi:hypothetical protein
MKIINGVEVISAPNISNPDIDGGTIDNCKIGETIPLAGTFTTGDFTDTLSADGQLSGVLINNQMVQKVTFDILSLMTSPRFLNLKCEDPGAGTMVDASGQGHDGTYQGSMTTDDRLKVGMGWTIDLDGIAHYVLIADHNDFSFGDGTNDSAVTFFGVAEFLSGTGDQTLISKYDLTTGNYVREYRMGIYSGREMYIVCMDESSNANAHVSTNNSIDIGYHSYAITYSGAGGAAAMDGMSIYIDGVIPANTVSNNGAYTAMENSITPCRIGALEGNDGNAADFFKGNISMSGIDGSEWSAYSVHRFHQLCCGLYGL